MVRDLETADPLKANPGEVLCKWSGDSMGGSLGNLEVINLTQWNK
jgi:hypothetical protein